MSERAGHNGIGVIDHESAWKQDKFGELRAAGCDPPGKGKGAVGGPHRLARVDEAGLVGYGRFASIGGYTRRRASVAFHDARRHLEILPHVLPGCSDGVVVGVRNLSGAKVWRREGRYLHHPDTANGGGERMRVSEAGWLLHDRDVLMGYEY